MRYIIRDKSRGYGVFDERYATRKEAEADLWRHFLNKGGDLVVEQEDASASMTTQCRERKDYGLSNRRL